MKGYVAISRDLFDHFAFSADPYSEREAWMWLIASAAWKPKKVRVGRTVYALERGQCAFSLRFLAEKWQWTKSGVWAFLKKIAELDMARTQGGRDATLITICNYDKYQSPSNAGRTPEERKPERSRDKEEPLNHITRHDDDGERATAFEIATEIGALCGHKTPEDWPPAFLGSPHTVEKWLRGGWPRDAILSAVSETLARKRDGPPENVSYFEKPIAKWIARQSTPLPKVRIVEGQTVEVRRETSGNVIAAADRLAARLAEFDRKPPAERELCGGTGAHPVRLLPEG